MRWPFGPPHLTLKPSKKEKAKKQKNKKTKKQKKENKGKTTQPQKKTIPKKSFSVISQFFLFFFWWVSKISLFDNLAKKGAHPKNTIKIGV